ncbi:MAG: hypothetical protein ACLFUB_20525 [Cyclobacteriaceae bacterium]
MKTRRTMKTIMCLCIMAGILLSCGKDEDVGPSSNFLPRSVAVYFQLRDAETKKDLFSINDHYQISSVKLYNNRITDTPWQDTIWHNRRKDTTFFMIPAFKLLSTGGNLLVPRIWILQLTETDFDTVEVAYSATSEYVKELEGVFHSPYSIRLDQLQVFYNGELINNWDLTDDEELRQRILGSEDPPINVIYKKPD